MSDYLAKVQEFHEQFSQPVLNTPTIPSPERCTLRVSLIQEELDELKTAIEEGNLIECLDALVDLQYVLSGTVHEFGLAKDFDQAFEEVHSSNMSKSCGTAEELHDTLLYYEEQKTPVLHERNETTGRYNVYRKSDGKVLKNVHYKKVDFTNILNQ